MATTQALGQKISDPAQLKNYREDQIVRVGSDIYLKPTQQAAATPSQPASNPFSSTNSDVQAQIAKMQGQVQALSSKAGQAPTSPSPAMSSPTPPKTTVPQSTYTPPAQAQTQSPTPPPQSQAAKIDLSQYGGAKTSTGAFTNVDFNRINSDYENVSAVGNPDQGGYYTGTSIPKATLISPTGQRVTVRTDGKSSPGLPSADEYFKQGFVLEKTPGVYDNGAGQKQTFGTNQLTPQAPKPPSAPTPASTGAGSAGLPAGYVRIPSTYATTSAQKSAFDDIKVSGNIGEPGSFLYGKPKEGTQTGGSDSGLGGLPGATGGTQLPSAFSSNDPTLQSILRNFIGQSAVGSKDAAGAAGTSEEEFNKKAEQYFLERDKQLKALEEAYYKDAMPSADEDAAQKAIDEIIAQQSNINSSKELGINEIKKQPIAMGFLAGQSSAVERDAATKIGALSSQSEPLKAKLASLQAKRTAALNVDKDRIGFARQDIKDLNEQMKPMEVGGNVVRYNPITKNYDTVYKSQAQAANQTNDIKEYEYAKSQGYKGGFQDWLKVSANLKDQASGGGLKSETDLRKEFNGLDTVKQYNDLNRYYTSMNSAFTEALTKNDNGSKAAADQALVTLFNKMLDPSSVVREGEYARSFDGQSALARAIGYIEQVSKGGAGLTDANRADMVQVAQKLFGDAQGIYNQNAEFYTNIADSYGLDPNRIIMGGFTGGSGQTQSGSGLNGLQPGIQPVSESEIQSVSSTYGVPAQEIIDTLNRRVPMQQIIEYLSKKAQASTPPTGAVEASAVVRGLPGKITVTNDLNKVMKAISTFESGNNYKSIGVKTSSGDRAYGKYQIMGNNIPSWSKAALGYSVTPQQFLASPDIQEKVANYKIGEYLKKYGNLEDVASVWFSGKPAANNFAKDANNTSVPKYISAVRSIYLNS